MPPTQPSKISQASRFVADARTLLAPASASHAPPSPRTAPQLSAAQRARPTRPTLSVVVPAYNEQECLPRLYERLTQVLRSMQLEYEIVLVDDGSRDATLPLIRRLAELDPRVRYGTMSRNFGHEAASTAGLDAARGDAVVLMDADLQDPPELIPQLLEQWRAGYDVVIARRTTRAGETWLKRASAWAFYRLLSRLSNARVPLDAGDFRLIDREVLRAFRRLREHGRFVRGMIGWLGYAHTTVEFERPARSAGQTKYNIRKLLNLAVDATVSLSTRPLRLALLGGLALCGLGLIGSGIATLVLSDPGRVAAAASLAVFAVGCVQIIGLATMAEYIARIHVQSQQRPLYLIRERGGTGLQFGRKRRGRPRNGKLQAVDRSTMIAGGGKLPASAKSLAESRSAGL